MKNITFSIRYQCNVFICCERCKGYQYINSYLMVILLFAELSCFLDKVIVHVNVHNVHSTFAVVLILCKLIALWIHGVLVYSVLVDL